MAGEIHVPGIGDFPRWAVFGGLGAVGIAIIMYYRSHGSGSPGGSSTAAAAAPSTDAFPPDGTSGNPDDPYSTDPATGRTYGDEQSGAYGTAAYGAYSQGAGLNGNDAYPWDGTTGNPNDPYSMDPSTNSTYGDEGYSTGTGVGQEFLTNGSWVQYAENYLTSTVGLSAGTVSSALGKYIAGQAVDSAQQDIINQAVAVAGYPPVSGAGGYPPSIRLSGTPNASGSISVPDVKGLDVAQAMQVISSSGLKTGHFPKSVPGVVHVVMSQSPKAGTKVNHGTKVNLTAGVKVPNVVGKSAANALGILSHAGLRGSVPPPVHGKVHIVTSQSPKAGTTVAIGSTVTLKVKTQ